MTKTRICRADELAPGAVRVFELDDVSVAVARAGNAVFALENRCSHDDGPLGEGHLAEGGAGGTEIECPRHGGRFALATGAASRMPAVSPILTFRATIEDGQVYVEIAE